MASSFIADVFGMARSKFTIIACGLVSAALTARYLGPHGSGVYAGLLVFPTLFMSLGSMGVRQSSTYLLGKGIVDEESVRRAILSIWILTSLIGVLVSYLLIKSFSSFHEPSLTLLATIAIPFSLYATYISGIYLGKNNIRQFNRIDWIPAVTVLVGNVVFVAILDMGVIGALLAHLLGPVVIFGSVVYLNPLPLRNYRIEFKIITQLLKLGAIYAISLLIINLNYRVDMILLDRLSTPSEIGIYAKGANITQYLWQIPMLLSTIVFARSATAANDVSYSQKVSKLLRVSILVIGAGSIVLYGLADLVVLVLYGTAFADSSSVIRILLPGVLIMTLFKVMNMDLAGKGKPWVAMVAMLPALILNVVANYFLIPSLGADGAAWASTISYTVAGILFIFVYSRQVKIPLREIFRFSREDFSFLMKKIRRA